MNKPVHFDIFGVDLDVLKNFYGQVFEWTFPDYSEFVDGEYFGVITGPGEEPGINGGLSRPEQDSAPRHGIALTMQVEDYDDIERKILAAGGKIVQSKYALPGMAWQGYYEDPEGNVFGLHQADENAS